jgi:DHA2 family multidrug resistance protein
VSAAAIAGAVERPVNPWFIAPVVALAAFMEVMDISIANVSLPHIAGDLSASQDESTWVLTSYLVTNAIVMPISGWLSNRFGRKNFFLFCIAGFTTSSLLCGLAPNLATLILLRAFQGATGGGLQPAGQAILADSFPPEKRGMATAIYGISAIFAPTIGPTLGGWITDSFDWRWIFLINVPVGVVLFLLVSSLIREPKVARATSFGVDWWGFSLVALSLGCLQVVMDRGQQDDWFGSAFITALTIMSVAAFAFLIWRELTTEHPMVDLRLLSNTDFAVSFVLMLMLGFMLLGSTYLVPAYVQSQMGYRAVDSGRLLTPGGLATIVMLPLVGRAVGKVDLRILVAIGMVICAGSLLWMTNFYLGVSFKVIMLARMVQGAGIAFLFIPINTMAFRSVPPHKINDASALVNLARNFGGSIGISFASTILTRRSQFHQSRLVEGLHNLNPNYVDYANQIGDPGSTATLGNVYQTAVTQAQVLSYLDAFFAVGLLFLALLPFLLLVKPGKGGGAVGVGH